MESKGKKKRDFRQIRGAIIMACVSLTVLSSATYAWFTISNQPRLTGLALTAGTVGGLEISDKADGTYGNELKYADHPGIMPVKNEQLNPVTTTGAAVFGKPVYSSNTVTGTEVIAAGEIYKTYLAKYEFYLKADGNGSYGISLQGGPTGAVGGTRPGCFVERNGDKSTKAADHAAYSVRIGFQTGSSWAIYEPNADQSVANNTEGTDRAYNNVTPGGTEKLFQQKKNGSFLGNGKVQSEPLFTIPGNTPSKVTMYIWLEGTDKDCANKIQADELAAGLQFVSKIA